MSLFLTDEEVKDLTGIKRGEKGKTREQLQCQHLREHGIPFFPNAAGQPKIARSFIEGNNTPAQKTTAWRSPVFNQ